MSQRVRKVWPRTFEFAAQLRKVVDFAIKDYADRFLVVRHGLVAALDIDNGEAPEAEADWSANVVALVIGAAMDHAARHLFYVAARHGRLPFVTKLSANSAHGES